MALSITGVTLSLLDPLAGLISQLFPIAVFGQTGIANHNWEIKTNIGSITVNGVDQGTDYIFNGTALAATLALPLSVGYRPPAHFGGGATIQILGDGAVLSSISVACFASGTRISTPSGPLAVEYLMAGDLVLTPWGESMPVKWVGRRTVDCKRHPNPLSVWPVRVSANAFAAGTPRNDLYLSPDHAIFHDGALIPVRYLINGATICQTEVDKVTYWHVELDRHDVILAEGLPTESYLDTGNRSAFANGGEPVALHPEFEALDIWRTQACGELVTSGDKLRAVKIQLLAQATRLGHKITPDPALRVLADGVPIRATLRKGRLTVRIPVGTTDLRLVSRRVRPCEARAGTEDTRLLGIAVSALTLDGKALATDDPRLRAGWHDVEEGGIRWTNGNAEIAVGEARLLTMTLYRAPLYYPASQRKPLSAGTRRALSRQLSHVATAA